MELRSLTIDDARSTVQQRKASAVSLAESFYTKIQTDDPKIGAYLTLSKERAFAKAAEIDKLAEKGERLPPLGGVPVAIKDVMVTKGVRTTAGSKILGNYIPPYDCTAVSRLEAAGAIVLGKLNCDEFAMGSSNENSAWKPVHNPRDLSRVPGGSSGGAAAAVAADMTVAALGSDTGGSIRQPASFCGVVGLMPTYGRVSRYGLIAFASSLDHIGPLAKTVRDAATVLGVIAGRDPMDSTSADVPVPDYVAELEKPVSGLKIGVAKEYFGEGLDTQVRKAVEAAIQDGVRYGFRAPEAHTLSQMYRCTRDLGFGAEVKRRIMLGTYALSAGYYDAYYLKAQRVRTLLTRDFEDAFRKVDAIVTPTSPTAAFKLGEKVDDPLAMYLADIYTVTADLAGIPGISVPCGETRENLPIGLQILGKHFDEATILRVAHAYEMSREKSEVRSQSAEVNQHHSVT